MALSISNAGWRTCFAIAILGILWPPELAYSQSTTPDSSETEFKDSESPDVVATVGDHKIYSRTVRQFIDRRIGTREQATTDNKLIKAHALEHLVRRAIVHEFLVRKNGWAGENAVRLDVEKFTAQLQRADISLADHLKERKTSLDQFEFETAWRISWESYLAKVLTDKVLASYFERNRTQFDGTQLKVAHLLFKPDSDSDDAEEKKLEDIRNQLIQQPLDWRKLVAKHSEAATKDQGGVIGWIRIDGPMPPDFTNEAFKLDVGEFSEPVKTKFGWHLIKCLEIKPGKKGPQDARTEVLAAAKQELFFKIANEQRDRSEIRFSGQWPHLDDSGKLAE